METEEYKTYDKPPVVEVIAEIVYEGAQGKPPWSQEVAAEFLRVAVPEQSRQEMIVHSHPEVTPEGKVTSLRQGVLRVRAFNKSNTRAVQVGNNYLACHLLRTTEPYKFQYLLEHVSQVLPVYERFFVPGKLCRMGLWYVDIIRIPVPEVRLDEYLRVGMQLPDTGQPATLRQFDCRAVLSLEERTQRKLDMRVRSIDEPSACSFRIDWHLTETPSALADISAWLLAADRELYHWFDSCLTPKCRDLFEPIQEGC